jgi:ankyrin repeat protein
MSTVWISSRDQQVAKAPQDGAHADADIWLSTACSTNNWTTVSRLLANNANPDERRTVSLWRPLHSAAVCGGVECANLLISYRADVNLVNDEGETPLMIAAAAGKVAIVQSLLRAGGVDLKLISNRGKTAINIARAEGHNTIVLLICAAYREKADEEDAIALKKQTKRQKQKERKLQQKDLKLALLTAEGNATALEVPVVPEHSVQVQMASSSREVINRPPDSQERLDTLDEEHFRKERARTEPNASDALSVACWKGDVTTISMLLAQGADINKANSRGEMALHVAARSGRDDIVSVLLHFNADGSTVARDGGQTALEIAKSMGHKLIVKVLAFYTDGVIEEEASGARSATEELLQAREEIGFWKREVVYRVNVLQATQQLEKATSETQLAEEQEASLGFKSTLTRERREAAEAATSANQQMEELLEEKQQLQHRCVKEKRQMQDEVNNMKREAKDKENKRLQMQMQTDKDKQETLKRAEDEQLRLTVLLMQAEKELVCAKEQIVVGQQARRRLEEELKLAAAVSAAALVPGLSEGELKELEDMVRGENTRRHVKRAQETAQREARHQLDREREAMRESRLCEICIDSLKDTALNCGHQACSVCAKELESCHLCRETITIRLKLYV